ncbi:DUF948 domain-containing protein [Paenibacillus sp. GCM10023252]|uniref:DUF948 domain-containing protein n=1 Tax=Paenibacillus sp. GCM10023252 TaxID=3252649 RepID=UPI00360C1F37
MSFQLSVTLIAVAFAALVVYAILTLRKTMSSLDETNKTLAEVRGSVNELTGEAKKLIRNANQVTADVKGKMKAVDPIIESAHDVGEVIQNVTHSVKRAALNLGYSLPTADSAPTPVEPSKHSVNVRVK